MCRLTLADQTHYLTKLVILKPNSLITSISFKVLALVVGRTGTRSIDCSIARSLCCSVFWSLWVLFSRPRNRVIAPLRGLSVARSRDRSIPPSCEWSLDQSLVLTAGDTSSSHSPPSSWFHPSGSTRSIRQKRQILRMVQKLLRLTNADKTHQLQDSHINKYVHRLEIQNKQFKNRYLL